MRAVLERDFLVEASRGRAFLFRTILGAAVVAAVLYYLHQRVTLLENTPDVVAREMFGAGGLALVVALVLFTPPAIVGAVLEERNRDTLGLVLAAPVSPRAFASAKLAARSMTVLLWAMAALVPLFLTTMLGGVGWAQVGELLALGLGVVIEMAAWGLWVSTHSSRLGTAAVFAYLLPLVRWAAMAGLLIASLAWPVPTGQLVGGRGGPLSLDTSRLLQAASLTTPVPAALNMVDPADFNLRSDNFLNGGAGVGEQVDAPDSTLWDGSTLVFTRSYRVGKGQVPFNGYPNAIFYSGQWVLFSNTPPTPPPPPRLLHPALMYLLFSLLLAMASLLLSSRRLAVESEPRADRFRSFLRRRGGLASPKEGANPVAWKEQRLLNTTASRPLFYAVFAVLVAAEAVYLSLGWTWVEDHSWEYFQAGLALATVHVVLLALVAVVSASASMAYERSTGTLDLLRMTRLTPTDIVRGKQEGIVRGLALVGLVPVGHLVFMGVAGSLDPVSVFVALAFEVLVVFAWAGIGIVCGMTPRSMEGAVRRGVACLGAAFVALPLAASMFDRGPSGFGTILRTAWLPEQFRLVLEASLHKCNAEWMYARAPGMFWPEPSPEEWTAVGTTVALGLLAVGGLWLAPGILARQFRRERETG